MDSFREGFSGKQSFVFWFLFSKKGIEMQSSSGLPSAFSDKSNTKWLRRRSKWKTGSQILSGKTQELERAGQSFCLSSRVPEERFSGEVGSKWRCVQDADI